MAILSHIQQMDSQIEFLYSTPNTLCKGKGLASLDVFSADKRSGVIFAFEEVVMVESRVSILVASVFSMLSVIQESSMESKDKMSYMNIVTFYMKTVKPFYEALANKTIQYLLPRGDDSKWQIEEANLIKRSNSVLAGININLNQIITTEW